mmetsp:Transcript_127867/g.249221  ORF Transcript_127867/g.249221 Transcript_127867/m.249221 type:complete len:95 (+) Transcript_127867:71-355(+)
MAMRGALQLTRRAMMRIEAPEFTKSRFSRRFNMMDEDRIKWYNWNLACIGLTFVPLAWMYTVNYETSEETRTLIRTLNPMGTEKIKYDLKLFGS